MTRRALVIGDVGGPEYHAGDEALLDVTITELHARGYDEITVVSKEPSDTARRYGVTAIAPIGFSAATGPEADRDRERRLGAVIDGVADDPAAAEIRRAVAGADAVVVAGGGNLSASWPDLLLERVALLRLATMRGRPTALVSQTVGPVLTQRQSALVAAMFADAALVGVREASSRDLVMALAPESHVYVQVDDAVAIPPHAVPVELPAEFVALVVHQFSTEPGTLDLITDLARSLHEQSAQPVVLFPNTGRFEGESDANSDVALAAQLVAQVGDPKILVAAPLLTGRQLGSALRDASAVISTRLHPLVFALTARVPAIALSSDDYTATKLDGVLRLAGLSGWRLPLAALGTPTVVALFHELWDRRTEVSDHLAKTTAGWRTDHDGRWDAIAAALAGTTDRPLLPPPMCESLEPRLTMAATIQAIDDRTRRELQDVQRSFAAAQEYAHSLRTVLDQRDIEVAGLRVHVGRLERDLAGAEAASIRAADELVHAQRSAVAARALNAEFIAERPTSSAVEEVSRRELEAIYERRLWRWSRAPRDAYSRVRALWGRARRTDR